MRQDTPLGPVWMVSDRVGEEVAKQTVRVELMMESTDGIVAMHTGPYPGGAFVVRAPRAVLEENGYPITSAAELPVKEGTAWPPLSEEGAEIMRAMDPV